MIAKPGHRFAVRVRFADEAQPRWLTEARDIVISICSVEPPLAVCYRERSVAETMLAKIGQPWSPSPAEPPTIVEVNVVKQLELRTVDILDELASIKEELAQTCTYPSKEQSDAGH